MSSLHLIGDEGELATSSDIRDFLEPFSGAGTNYHVVAIFGGQSSGKSTLLNQLFHTRFATMQAEEGRHQTTKGAFMSAICSGSDGDAIPATAASAAGDAERLLVVDVEGTDGIERGEDQTFERQLSLFALSIADTLIINMWASDVGRFNAANLNLLRTTFEVNLRLLAADAAAKGNARTVLLFLLRDFAVGTLDKAREVMLRALGRVWDSVVKPDAFKDADIADIFDLRFATTAHYELAREQFDADVVTLRGHFLGRGGADYIFQETPQNIRDIPLHDLPLYFENVWTSVRSNKDLDIPTQRQLLAQVRCQERFDSAVVLFSNALSAVRTDMESRGTVLSDLQGFLDETTAAAMADFDEATSLYGGTVAKELRAQLQLQFAAAADRLRAAHAAALAEAVVGASTWRMQAAIDMLISARLPELARLWAEQLDAARKSGSAEPAARHVDPMAGADDGMSSREASWSLHERTERMLASVKMTPWVNKFWGALQSEMDVLSRDVSLQLRRHVDDYLKATAGGGATTAGAGHRPVKLNSGDGASPSGQLPSTASAGEAILSDVLRAVATVVARDTSALQQTLIDVGAGLQGAVRERLRGMTADPAATMTSIFERQLHHSKDGRVRLLSSLRALEEAFKPARATGLLFLAAVFTCRVSPALDAASVPDDVEHATAAELKRLLDAFVLEYTPEPEAGKAMNLVRAPLYPAVAEPEQTTPTDDTDTDAQRHNAHAAARHTLLHKLVLVDEANARRAFDLFQQHCDFTWTLTLKQIESGAQHTPWWTYALIVGLGWNEFIYVVTSPMLVIIISIIVYSFFRQWVVQQYDMFIESGPPLLVIPLQSGVAWISQQVDKYVAPALAQANAVVTGTPNPVPPPALRGTPSPSSSKERRHIE